MNKKIKLFLSIICLFAASIIVGVFVMSNIDFMGDCVAVKFGDALSGIAPIKLSHGEISGNPMTGVEINDVKIKMQGEDVLQAAAIIMRVDMTSIFGEPRLETLEIVQPIMDPEQLIHIAKEMRGGESSPAVKTVRLKDVVISQDISELNGLNIRRADIDLSDRRYDIEISGSYEDRDLVATARIEKEDGDMLLRDLDIRYGSGRLSASGKLSPAADIKLNVKNLSLGDITLLKSAMGLEELDGDVEIDAIFRPAEQIIVSGAVSSTKIAYGQYEIKNISTKFQYDQEVNILMIDDGKGEILDIPINVKSFKVDLGKERVSYKVYEITAKDVDLDKLSKRIDLENSLVSGIVSVAADISGQWGEMTIYPKISGGKLMLAGVELLPVDTRITTYGDKEFNIVSNIHALGGRTRVEAKVVIASDTKDISSIVRAEELEAAKLLEIINKDLNVDVKGKISIDSKASIKQGKPDINADINTRSLKIDGVDVSDLSVSMTYSNDQMNIKHVKGSLFNGIVEGEGKISLKEEIEESAICFTGNISNISADHINRSFLNESACDVQGFISGGIEVSGTLSAPLVNADLLSPKMVVDGRYVVSEAIVSLSSDLSSVLIDKLEANVVGTKAFGSGEVFLPSDDRPISYDFSIETSKVDSAYVLSEDLTHGVRFSMASNIRARSDADGAPVVRLLMKDADFTYSPYFNGTQFDGEIEFSGGKLKIIRLDNAHEKEWVSMTGNVEFRDDIADAVLDLDVHIGSADIGRISRIFVPESKGYEGFATGHARIVGPISNTRLAGEAEITRVRAFGLFLPKVSLRSISSDFRSIEMPDIDALVGHGEIDANCTITLGASPDLRLEAHGRSVDIRSVTYNVDREIRRELTGSVDFNFKGAGWLDSFNGSGSVDIPYFKGMGLQIDDFDAEFMVSDGFVLIEDSSARAYGGELRMQLAKDLHLTRWGGRFILKSADLGLFMKDAVPDMEGEVTGIADLVLRIGGDSTRTSLQDADGTLDIKSGDISGFKGIESLSKISGGKNVAYNEAHFPFSVDGKTIYILPGARITAPSRGNIFKYIALDGSIVIEDQSFNLSILGNINIRALNFMLGGLQSVMAATVKNNAVGSTNEVLQNFLGGAITGFSRNEFRDISMVVSGDIDNFSVSKLLLSERQAIDVRPDILSKSDEQKKEDEHLFKLKVEFPVGPGGSSEGGVAGQVSGQILEQAIKSLFKR